jgi:hypothetical protein
MTARKCPWYATGDRTVAGIKSLRTDDGVVMVGLHLPTTGAAADEGASDHRNPIIRTPTCLHHGQDEEEEDTVAIVTGGRQD